MAKGFLDWPTAERYRVGRATLPAALTEVGGLAVRDGLAIADLIIAGGRIEAILPPGPEPSIDIDHAMVFPGFVDAHTHLDKGHIWPRASNPDGSFPGALATVSADRTAHWTADDIRTRMDFALRSAFAHGTVAIRTHLDSTLDQMPISWPVFAEMRDRWAGRIALQGSSLAGIQMIDEPDYLPAAASTVKRFGGVLGAVTYMIPGIEDVLDRIFLTALDHGLGLDFHVDETLDPEARSLRLIAEAAIRHGWSRAGLGTILCGHCCSVSAQAEQEALTTLDRVAEAGLAVVSLPMCNMYLQDRAGGRTPRRRGVTLLHEMAARGIAVMVASDNTRDPFYAYGDLDMIEVYREATRILHFDHPVGAWPATIGTTPAKVCGFAGAGTLKADAAADLVVTRGRTWTEVLSRPQSDRVVVRSGRAIDTTLPDYRELDHLWSRS